MTGPWLAVLGAAVGVSLVWAGARRRIAALGVAGLVLLAAAALRMVVWESYPDLLGSTMAPWWQRAAGYTAVLGGVLGAAWLGRAGRVRWGLLLAAYLVGGWWITFEATLAINAAHNGQLSGNEGMLVAGLWGLYGLLLALLERRFGQPYLRNAARLAAGGGLAFLLLGPVLANGRWAAPGYRVFSYTAVFGAIWAAEALFARRGEDGGVQGLASLAAAVAGPVVAGFEMRLWLDRSLFTFAPGLVRSEASLMWEMSVRAYAAIAVWALWALGVAVAGRRLRSWRVRLLAEAIFAVALGYLALGAFRPGAPLLLRLTAQGLLAGGAVLGWRLSRTSAGERHPLEEKTYRWLLWATAGVLLLAGVAHFSTAMIFSV